MRKAKGGGGGISDTAKSTIISVTSSALKA